MWMLQIEHMQWLLHVWQMAHMFYPNDNDWYKKKKKKFVFCYKEDKSFERYFEYNVYI